MAAPASPALHLLRRRRSPSSSPTLLRPEPAAVVRQSNPESGCPFAPGRGYAFIIQFDWSDVAAGAALSGYEIRLQAREAIPAFTVRTTSSDFLYQKCNAYVPDSNLGGWAWSVRVVDRLGQLGPAAERSLSFAPCRIGASPCF